MVSRSPTPTSEEIAMPVLAPPVTDERDGLLKFLETQRNALRASVFGLDREQATSTPSVSANSVAGLVKHTALTERHWIQRVMMQRELPQDDYEQTFTLRDDESVEGVLALSREVGAETEALMTEIDLDREVSVPDAPWFPKDVKSWSARWVLLHLIEETARHAGHADIIRESIDGSNAFVLLMKSEGNEPEWLAPLESN
jgi:uncharacterized damage-inducible protein DinB